LFVSLGVVTVLYIGLQIAFIGALDQNELKNGWSSINFNGIFGPFAGLATALGLGWLALILYVDAFLSPASNGLIYVTTTSRIAYGLARNRYVPAVFAKISRKSGIPVLGVISTFVVSVIFLLPFPGWQTLVGFITSAIALMWAGVPISLGALRRQQPETDRPFRLKFAGLFAPLGFVVANLIVYWSGWAADSKIFLAVIIGFVIFAVNRAMTRRDGRLDLNLRSAVWVWPWLIGMAVISYLGTFSSDKTLIFELPHLPFGYDALVVTAWSLIVYRIAMAVHLPEREIPEDIEFEEDTALV
jgi:amino acid transporter